MAFPDIEKQKHVKNQATKMATGLNDVAAVTGAAAAVYGAIGLLPAAAAYGIFSGLCWWTANRYQELSSDPPRRDFTVVSLPHVPRSPKCCRPPFGAEDRLYGATDRFFALGRSLGELRIGLERYQGAQAADDAKHSELQLEVARYAAVTVANIQEEILRESPLLNLDWHAGLNRAGAFEPGYTVDVENARATYPRYLDMGLNVLERAYSPATLEWDRIKPEGEHPIYSDGLDSAFAPRVFQDALLDALETTVADLRGLIVPGVT